MKKFFFILLAFFMMLFQSVCADEMFKIKGIDVDTSAAVFFINTIGNYQTSITDNIKLVKLSDEKKVYFDINSAVLVSRKQDIFLSRGDIKEVKISQFTTNPNVVRVVLQFNSDYDISNLKIGNIDNHLIIMTSPLNEKICQFYQNTYRDKPKTAEDYYSTLKLEMKSTTPQAGGNIKTIAQVQQAFNNSTAEEYVELVKSPLNDNITLRSKYYISDITPVNEGVRISGYGSPILQKPFVLTNPNRMVFDIANSDFDTKFANGEINLNQEGDKLRIARFDNNVTRIVITSNDAKQYLPIFSFDNQSLMLVNPNKLSNNAFAKNRTNIVEYKYNKNLSTDDLTLRFDNPVIWGIKRNSDNLFVYFFNAAQYNESTFKSVVNDTPYGNAELALLKGTGIRFCLPVNLAEDVNTYFSADGKNFRIRTSGLKPVKAKEKKETPVIKNSSRNKCVVIDAGHGGTDYGAIRDGINEKDINLDVAKRVEAILTKKGYKVYMTRSEDVFLSLEERCQITNSVIPNLFVSIHVNSCVGTEPKGIETHYYHDNSIELANVIHSKMVQEIKTPNRGLFKSKFYVINHTSVPAVLLEIGFISNEQERAELVTVKRKQATAHAIAEGIIEYINKNCK